MSTTSDSFTDLSRHAGDPAAMLDELVEQLRGTDQAHELFEALKMRLRHRLGLPVVMTEEMPQSAEEIERQLEAGLIDACREVGQLLLRRGRVREGWMYLRPTGDVAQAAALIAEIEPTEENLDELLQVLLHEAVDVGRGLQLLLEHRGTCNSITMYDQLLSGRPVRDRRAGAARLLQHVYDELLASVRADIARREGNPPEETASLQELIEPRRDLLSGGAYHLDTTHLASTVRFARVLEEPELLQKAWELTQYGRRLHPQYQYPGEEPFTDFYPSHARFFAALLGRGADAAVDYFGRKAREVEVEEHGTGAIEAYVDLLDRLGRPGEALRAAIELVPMDVPSARLTPLLLELAGKADDYEPVRQFCRRRGDLLGFTAASIR